VSVAGSMQLVSAQAWLPFGPGAAHGLLH